jgi:hypothetical protein
MSPSRSIRKDEISKEATDFGFIGKNSKDKWAFLPIEFKLPAALGGAPAQMSELIPRLQNALKVIFLVEEGGKEVELAIDPKDLLFAEESLHQVAVAPLTGKQWARAMTHKGYGGGKVMTFPPGEIGGLFQFVPAISEKHEVIYYRCPSYSESRMATGSYYATDQVKRSSLFLGDAHSYGNVARQVGAIPTRRVFGLEWAR